MKATKILFISTLILFFFNAKSQNCSQFREGKFTYKELSDDNYTIRKDDKQTSYYPGNIVNEFKIEWKDSCNFIMTFKRTSDPEKMKTYKRGDIIYVRILETDGGCYKFEAVFKGRKYPTTYMCKEEETK